jgi:hypothetical protein
MNLMTDRSLEITFRHGRAVAAYLYLPRASGDHAARSREMGRGLVVDFAADARPIGIEILDPARVTAEEINSVLAALALDPLTPEEVRPLRAA